MRQVHFLDEAELEYIETEEKLHAANMGAGDAFVAAVDRVLVTAVEHPFGYARSEETTNGNIRRAVISRFYCSVIYEVFDAKIVVLAIADSRREPGYWMERT